MFHVFIKDGELYHKGERIDIESITHKAERYLLQMSVGNQDSTISTIFPKSINTLRLVTVHNYTTDKIEVLSCVLRVGTGDNDVDNWAAGGLSIGVDTEKDCLRKYGFFKPGYGTKVTEHPNTHIIFEGYPIPCLQSAICKAKSFHGHLRGIHSIGWDIAITENGPCFIEGNDNWEISLMQISNQGLQEEFDRLFY